MVARLAREVLLGPAASFTPAASIPSPGSSLLTNAGYHCAPASGAFFRSTRSIRDVPLVPALLTPKGSLFGHLDLASFDAKGQAFDQHPCNLRPCSLDNSSKSLPRHMHSFCRLFMVKPLKIGQSDSLELVHCEVDLLQHCYWHADRLEYVAGRLFSDSAAALRSGHPCSLSVVIISVCS